MEIKDRVAVVTGGASGIGRSLCLAFAEHGAAAVVVSDIDAQGAAQVAAEITGRGQPALAVTSDVASEPDVQALVAQAEQAFGRIDLVCSNAGSIVARGSEVPQEEWASVRIIQVFCHADVAEAGRIGVP